MCLYVYPHNIYWPQCSLPLAPVCVRVCVGVCLCVCVCVHGISWEGSLLLRSLAGEFRRLMFGNIR